MIEYKIEDFNIMYINGKRLNFHYKIEKVFDSENMLIIFLGKKISKKEHHSTFYPYNGIYAISSTGEILWNIEMFFRPGHPLKGIKVLPVYRFIDADMDEKGNLIVHTDMGIGYILNIEKEQITGYFKSSQRPVNSRGQTIPYRKTSKTTLEINGRELNFSYRIKRIIELNNTLIVHVDSPEKSAAEQPENNIYAVSPEGEVLWNIEEFFRPDNADKLGSIIEPYESILLDDDKRYLKVYTYNRVIYTLDIKEKKVIKKIDKKNK